MIGFGKKALNNKKVEHNFGDKFHISMDCHDVFHLQLPHIISCKELKFIVELEFLFFS